MLVATRRLNCFGQTVEAGQPIPSPERWNVVSLQSNINIGWIKEVSAVEKPAENPDGFEFRCGECHKGFKTNRALGGHKRVHQQ